MGSCSTGQTVIMTFLLVLLVLVVAAAGGFLGDLLQLAGLLVALMALAGAIAGVGLWLLIKRTFAQ